MSVNAPRPFVVLLSTVVVAYVVRALLASPVAWASLLWPALSLGAVFGSRKAAMALGYLFCFLGAMFLLICGSREWRLECHWSNSNSDRCISGEV